PWARDRRGVARCPAPHHQRPWPPGPAPGPGGHSARPAVSPVRSGAVIVMDRENLWAKGWSHVLSTTNDVAELRAFCERVGAPAAALHLGNRRWPHLDLKLLPRERALIAPDV